MRRSWEVSYASDVALHDRGSHDTSLALGCGPPGGGELRIRRRGLQPAAVGRTGTIAINVAVAGRAGSGTKEAGYPVDVEEYVDSASEVIEAGACGVHIDFTWVTDSKGRRLDKDLSPVEAYGLV